MKTDDTFRVPTPAATDIVATASCMHEYLCTEHNREEVKSFSRKLFDMQIRCLTSKYKRSQKQREKMFTKYHQMRGADVYNALWRQFTVAATGRPPNPLFYHFIGRKLFHRLIKNYYVIYTRPSESQVQPLTYQEQNVVRYIAGAACHSVRDRVSRMKKCEMKERMLIAVGDLEGERSSESTASSSTDWLKAVDRGGLFHVTDEAYDFFCSMELLVRTVFNVQNVTNIDDSTKKLIRSKVLDDEDLMDMWEELMEEVESSEASRLLGMLVDLYITTRGNWFAKTLVEEYKLELKQGTQKAKSLRTKVQCASTSTGLDNP